MTLHENRLSVKLIAMMYNIISADWKEKLLEVIDADQLPEHWGGTQRDPDGNPKCPSKVSERK